MHTFTLLQYNQFFMSHAVSAKVVQAVKDTLQSLVDDGLVNMEKIGTSNYFWSYPSAAIQTVTMLLAAQRCLSTRCHNNENTVLQKRNKVQELEEAIVELEKRNASLDDEIAKALANREPSVSANVFSQADCRTVV
jgi:hypothetical protein